MELVLHHTSILLKRVQNQFSSRPVGPESVTGSPGDPWSGTRLPNLETRTGDSAGGHRSTTKLDRDASMRSRTCSLALPPNATWTWKNRPASWNWNMYVAWLEHS